jgi:hypothetical protein
VSTLVLSPIHILNSLIVLVFTISFAFSFRPTSYSQSPFVYLSPWKKCLAQVSASPSWPQMDSWLHSCLVEMSLVCLLWDLWIGCCMYIILVYTLMGFMCVCVDRVGNVPLLVMNVLWQTRGWKHWSTSYNLFNNHVETKPVLFGSSFFKKPPIWS